MVPNEENLLRNTFPPAYAIKRMLQALRPKLETTSKLLIEIDAKGEILAIV